MKGRSVLVLFPFTDLSAVKRRPALVLHERDRDLLVAFISSRIPERKGFNTVVVDESTKGFDRTGLKRTSGIYTDKLATLAKEMVSGEIGSLGRKWKRRVNRSLKKVLFL